MNLNTLSIAVGAYHKYYYAAVLVWWWIVLRATQALISISLHPYAWTEHHMNIIDDNNYVSYSIVYIDYMRKLL